MQLPVLLLAHGHLASLGGLFLHCCPARRWWEHRIRTCSQAGVRPSPHHSPPALPFLQGTRCPAAAPSLTRSPGGPSAPGVPCRERTGEVRRREWLASMHGGHHRQRTHLIASLSCWSRLTLVSRCTLCEQATGVQMRQVSGFWSKALCTWASSASKSRLAQEMPPPLAEDTPRQVFHPPSLQGCRECPAGQVFHRLQAPPSQGHKALSRLHPAVDFGSRGTEVSGASVHSKPLCGLLSFPWQLHIPRQTPPPLHLPNVSHL